MERKNWHVAIVHLVVHKQYIKMCEILTTNKLKIYQKMVATLKNYYFDYFAIRLQSKDLKHIPRTGRPGLQG